MAERLTFWTLGHSSADVDHLFHLLREQRVDILADVRSSPYSQYAPQANREVLAAVADRCGVQYVFLGEELGGRPADPAMMLPNGKPDYGKMQGTPQFQRGIQAIEELAGTHRVCLLCSEEDPARCHRSLLVAETLTRRGHQVLHIRHDGHTETHAEMKLRRDGGQLLLFETR
ncbi:MAG: DUF488 family protein [Phycisphaerae bacterium]